MFGSENLMTEKSSVLIMILITLSKVKLKWKISKGQSSKESHFINFSYYSRFVPGYF